MCLAEWLYEDGIGEERAILVENGRIVVARIERHQGMRAGLVAQAQLVTRLVANTRGIVKFADDSEALLSPLPKGLNEAASLMVEVTRAAIDEKSRFKLPVVKGVPDQAPRSAPTLLEQIGKPAMRCNAHEQDHFEAFGWSELLEEARTGYVAFAGGTLQIALTPAMTLVDVDGDLAAPLLALVAATAAAKAIRRFDLQGNIGIDFPTLEAKSDRQAATEAFDQALFGPCERTVINGFGFMQILTRRTRQSIPEMVQYRPALAEALALLRRAERNHGTGVMTLVVHHTVIAQIEPGWITMLARRAGRAVSLRVDPRPAIGAGYVEATA